MLIRAVYRGVFFHQPLTPGTSTVDVTILSPPRIPRPFRFPCACLSFSPTATSSWWAKNIPSQNNSNPPAAYYKQDGNFEFTIPAGAELDQVSTFGPPACPCGRARSTRARAATRSRTRFSPDRTACAFPTSFPTPATTRQPFANPTYDAQRVLLVIPPTMQISSAGFDSAGTEQGFNVFSKDSVKAGTRF
jgi:hypothetical protein